MPRLIAVLGAGLSGLSAALHLARRFPTARLVLLERASRVGGWVRSARVSLPTHRSVLLEAGPRSLRPVSPAVLELIHLLALEDTLITVPTTSPAAKARFICDPESTGLQRLPSTLSALLTSPMRALLWRGVLRDVLRRANADAGADVDESLESLLQRRFGDDVARLLGSALVHGVYAADSRCVSVRAAFAAVKEAEQRGGGSVVLGMAATAGTSSRPPPRVAYELGDVEARMQAVSTFSFRQGMETLPRAMLADLCARPNVDVRLQTLVRALRRRDAGFDLHLADGTVLSATHVVSALPLPALHAILSSTSNPAPRPPPIPHLTANPLSTVYVLNLVFAAPPVSIHPEGFGYLVPRPIGGYPTADAEDLVGRARASLALSQDTGILGTVFDSCSLHAQDMPPCEDYYHAARYTKMTVMLGGPYEHAPMVRALGRAVDEGTVGATLGKDVPPAVQAVVNAVGVHLGWERDAARREVVPVCWRVWRNPACIPTLLPGHLERMKEMRGVLAGDEWGSGRLEVVGAGVDGVSVGDCVESGRKAGTAW